MGDKPIYKDDSDTILIEEIAGYITVTVAGPDGQRQSTTLVDDEVESLIGALQEWLDGR